MNRDHQPITIDNVNGLYDRSSFDDATPEDHLTIARNLVYSQQGFSTRYGTSLVLGNFGSIHRFSRYKKLDEVSRFLVLDEGGNLFDSLNPISPILQIPGMTDFSAAQYYNRIYITPHNRVRGLENGVVYVYDGTTCRPAGGTSPSGTLTVVNSALSGNVEFGTHLIAVSFETESGYITKPGPSLYGTVLADGTHQIDISGIPIGPPGTIARRILATRRIPEYAGNQNDYEFFFVPGGRIENNVDTEITLNFYDADLQASADYLFDLLATIPAGLGIGVYSESLIVWGEYDNPSVVRVSRQGDPESFDGVEGYLTVAPNDAGPVTNAAEFRDSLYITKQQRTYATARDSVNTNSPIFWKVNNIDEGIGTGPFGISQVLDSNGPNQDSIILASRVGLTIFNGIYTQPELSWKVSSIWESISFSQFNKVQSFNDVVGKRIYTLLTDGTILVGDYQNGLNFQSIRWSVWTFPWSVSCIGLDVEDSSAPAVLYLAGGGNLWRITSSTRNDGDFGISTKVRFGPKSLARFGEIVNVSSVRYRIKGLGVVENRLYGMEDSVSFTMLPFALSTTPGKEYFRLANLSSEKVSLEIELDGAGEYLEFLRASLFMNPIWMERPNVT